MIKTDFGYTSSENGILIEMDTEEQTITFSKDNIIIEELKLDIPENNSCKIVAYDYSDEIYFSTFYSPDDFDSIENCIMNECSGLIIEGKIKTRN